MANIILVALFPLIFLIALGYVLKRFRFLEDKFWHGAEKLNYYLLFPVMLFLGLAHAEIQASEIRHMMLGAGLTLLIAVCLLYILKALYGTAAARFGVYMQGMVRFNTYIGLALSASLFISRVWRCLLFCWCFAFLWSMCFRFWPDQFRRDALAIHPVIIIEKSLNFRLYCRRGV